MNLNLEDGEEEAASSLLPKFYIPVEKLVYDQPGSIYAVYERVNGACPTGMFSCPILHCYFLLRNHLNAIS